MIQKSGPSKQPAEDAIKNIRRATRRHFSAEGRKHHASRIQSRSQVAWMVAGEVGNQDAHKRELDQLIREATTFAAAAGSQSSLGNSRLAHTVGLGRPREMGRTIAESVGY